MKTIGIGGADWPNCSGKGYSSVSVKCERDALQKAAVCPGCGKLGTTPGRICKDCEKAVEAGRKALAASVDKVKWTPSDHGPDSIFGDIADRLIEALGVVGAETTYQRAVLVPETAVPALDGLRNAIVKAEIEALRKGRREGSGLLVKLAEGSASVDDYNKIAAAKG